MSDPTTDRHDDQHGARTATVRPTYGARATASTPSPRPAPSTTSRRLADPQRLAAAAPQPDLPHRPRDHRRVRRAGDHRAVDRAVGRHGPAAARRGPARRPTRCPGPRPVTRSAATTGAATCSPGCSSAAAQTLIVGVFATLFGLIGGLVLGTLAGRRRRLGRLARHAHRRRDAVDPVAAARLHHRLAGPQPQPVDADRVRSRSIQVPIFARLLRGSMLAQRAQRPRPRGALARRRSRARSCSGTCCPTRSAR